MRITLLQGAFLPVPPLRGGAVEKMWFRLGQEFAARGHKVTHVSRWCDGLPEREEIGGVEHRRVRGYDQPAGGLAIKWRDGRYSRRAVRAAPAADLVVTNTFWSPLLLHARQGAIYVDVQRMPKGQMRLYRRAARLRANSSAVRDAILAELPSAAPRVGVIPNPLPFVPDRPVNWAAKTRTVLYVGRIHPEKGIELLLEAWALCRARGALRDWTLELIGPAAIGAGGGGAAWQGELRRRHPLENVIWREPIFDVAELNARYEQAAVFVYPSLADRGETFGLAVLEAMAWGAVPVVSDLACFRDFVVPGENGRTFDHRAPDRARRLAEALEKTAGMDARAWAQRAVDVRVTHSVPAIADLFAADFARVAGGG
jgi:glycosyltransferase involved in cell wall biosynthesis